VYLIAAVTVTTAYNWTAPPNAIILVKKVKFEMYPRPVCGKVSFAALIVHRSVFQ
jgi:hypothetical protein